MFIKISSHFIAQLSSKKASSFGLPTTVRWNLTPLVSNYLKDLISRCPPFLKKSLLTNNISMPEFILVYLSSISSSVHSNSCGGWITTVLFWIASFTVNSTSICSSMFNWILIADLLNAIHALQELSAKRFIDFVANASGQIFYYFSPMVFLQSD